MEATGHVFIAANLKGFQVSCFKSHFLLEALITKYHFLRMQFVTLALLNTKTILINISRSPAIAQWRILI